MDLNAQVTDELVLSFYTPAGAPVPDRLDVVYHVKDDTLEAVIEELGGVSQFQVSGALLTRRVPLTYNGEQVGALTLHVFLNGPPARPMFPAIERLLAKAAEVA